jgi:tRNA(Arg) A34 adenosine deaminase TadA
MPKLSPVALSITMPDWVDAAASAWALPLESDAERMALAIALAELNVQRGGGPFAALVFADQECLGAGVNRVMDSGFSIAHAEILALMTAQARAIDRISRSGRPLTLVTTTEPCCQCFGALVWAGVERLVCGAVTADAEAIGFDEGPKPPNWIFVLEQRGVEVVREVLRPQAAAVLQRYARSDGPIYNAPVR